MKSSNADNPITVYKLNEKGQKVWQYEGVVLARGENFIQLEAIFARQDYVTSYHIFRKGDRMVEWFYSDCWYNIFQMHDVDDDQLKGWYCNITRPARLEENAIYAEDLALDVFVYPDGRWLVLDEDEFAALELDDSTRQMALQELDQLKKLIENAEGIFSAIQNKV